MGDSSVNLATPTGSADTRTNTLGEHREVVVLGGDGDPVATLDAQATKVALDVNLAGSAGGVAQVSGTVTNAANQAVTANVAKSGNATVSIVGGVFTGLPIIFEATVDGTTWFGIDATQADGTGINTQITLPANGGPRNWNIICPGYQSVRVRLTGTAASFTTSPTIVIAQGPFLVDPSPTVAPIDGQKGTFSVDINAAGAAGVANALDAGNFGNPAGSGKTIRITRLRFQVSLATAAVGILKLVRRTAANTGGTAAIFTVGRMDTADPANISTGGSVYTAAPSAVGAQQAVLKVVRAQLPVAPGLDVEWTFGNRPAKALVLRPGEYVGLLVLNATGGAAATAPTITGDFEWTEE